MPVRTSGRHVLLARLTIGLVEFSLVPQAEVLSVWQCTTVDMLIMHMIVMHFRHFALIFGGSHVGPSQNMRILHIA